MRMGPPEGTDRSPCNTSFRATSTPACARPRRPQCHLAVVPLRRSWRRRGRVRLSRRSAPQAARSVADERVHEGSRVERREVVRALAEADELDRYAQLALYGDHDAALRRAVELGEH